MSKIIKTAAPELSGGKDKRIRDIPAVVKRGARMTKGQLRFAMCVAVFLVMLLIAVIIMSGSKSNEILTHNEQKIVLDRAIDAERVEAPRVKGANVLKLTNANEAPAEGQQYILLERASEKAGFWLSVSTDKDYEQFLADLEALKAEKKTTLTSDRFAVLKRFDTAIFVICMAEDKDLAACADILAEKEMEFVPVGQKLDDVWGWGASEEENRQIRDTWNNLEFFQYKNLGKTVRFIPTMDDQADRAEESKNHYRLLRLLVILLLCAAMGVFAYTLKSAKFQKKYNASRQKLIRLGSLGLAVLLLAGVVVLSINMNREADTMVRTSSMILDAKTIESVEDAESEEVRQFISEDPNKQGTWTTVVAYEEESGFGFQRAAFYGAIVLLVIVLFAAIYFFRYERDLGFSIFNAVILIGLMFVTIYPVLNTVAVSFNEGNDAARGGITILPRKFSMVNYDEILDDRTIKAAWISASKTVIITLLNLFWTGMLAYTLSRKEYVFRKSITTIMVLTMYVNAGLIPNYLLISQTLNLAHTYLVYIIPTMFSCFNMIVIRTYIAGLPDALVESAKIDGAGDFRVYWQIIFPLCTPVLATVALFVAVGSWNSWFDTRLYNANQNDPQTLQYLLQMKILNAASQGQAKAKATADAMQNMEQTQSLTVQAAVTVVSTVPILVVYPVLQRYFVTGMALGAVKG